MTRSRFTLCGTAMLVVLGQSAVALAADCFVDSVAGDDGKDGSSEANAVKTQAKIPKACTVVKYKRGSLFNEKVAISGSAKTFTNYGTASDPLPKFIMPGTTNTGAVVSSYQGGVTVDGLYLANSHGDGSSASFSTGVCVTLGSNSVFQNNEITSCDIGVMLSGTGSKFLNNYVHDLTTMIVDAAQDSGTYINSIGGAEAIFINGSNNEVAYNTFVNCSGVAQWTGGGCDGGATEVSISSGGTVSGVKIHHNFALNTCGFFEVSGKGTFADSEFYYNVAIDSGWLMLLQVNETTMSNIRWENNTVVHHKGSSNAGMVTTIYGGSGTSGGTTSGVTLPAGQVSMTNNLIILDGITAFGSTIDANIAQTTNLVATTNPGVKNIKGTAAADFDLVEGSAAIDKGSAVSGMSLDYLNRAVPNGATDIGAFEYGATTSTTAGGTQGFGGTATVTGGASTATAGKASATSGGAAAATGGKASTTTAGGTATSTSGGLSSTTTGGTAQGNGGNSTALTVGGAQNTSGGSTIASSTGGANDTVQVTSGGSTGTAPPSTDPGVGGASDVSAGGATATSGAFPVGDESGCACRVAHSKNFHAAGLGLFALALLGLRRSRRTHVTSQLLDGSAQT